MTFRTRAQREADQFNANARREQNNTPASEKQLAFIANLETQLNEKLAKAVMDKETQNMQRWYGTQKARFEFAKRGGFVNKKSASFYIQALLMFNEFPVTLRGDNMPVERQQSALLPNTPRRERADIGVYKYNDKVYRVAKARTSNARYAYEWKNRSWDYAGGVIFDLKPEHRMTLEQVAEFGIQTGMCAICGRTLTDPDSVAKGIGPICEQKYGSL